MSTYTREQADAIFETARARLLFFVKLTMNAYDPQPFHVKIASALESVERGDTKRLIICMPPRYGKTELASVRFPAWFLGRNPDKRVIQASYAAGLARTFGRKARNLLTTDAYRAIFDGISTAQDTKAADEWNIANHDGGYISAGVGGGLTGHGGDVCLIDDPFSGPEDAQSKLMRDKAWEWYTDVLKTRVQGLSAIILIQTRWHEDDLAGRLLAEDDTCERCNKRTAEHDDDHPFKRLGDGWTLVEFPALTETDDGYDALWPARHDVGELLRLRAQNPRTFASLYQQRPAPQEGNLFKREWFQHVYRDLPENSYCIQAIDTAYKTGVGNDYSVIATWATNGTNYYLVDIWRGRVEYPDLRRMIAAKAEQYKPRGILIEDAASGQSVIQDLRRNTPLPIIPERPKGSKEDRADAVSHVFESGRVFVPDQPWVATWMDEHLIFPNGTNDDQVDTTSMALGRLVLRTPEQRQSVPIGVTSSEERPWRNAFHRKRHGAEPPETARIMPKLRY